MQESSFKHTTEDGQKNQDTLIEQLVTLIELSITSVTKKLEFSI